MTVYFLQSLPLVAVVVGTVRRQKMVGLEDRVVVAAAYLLVVLELLDKEMMVVEEIIMKVLEAVAVLVLRVLRGVVLQREMVVMG